MKLFLNWKMNPQTKAEAKNLTHITRYQVKTHQNDVVILPPTIFFNEIRTMYSSVGVQDVSAHVSGAYTGQLSARMARHMGARYALVGHSERRREQHETDIQIAEKILRAQEEKIIPIICVGEMTKKKQDAAWREIKKHIDIFIPSLRGIKKYVIAYEPIWAIGTGTTAEAEYISEMICRIKLYIRARVYHIPWVVYGGSVNGKTIESLLHYRNVIDGFLVGSASIQTKELSTIIKKIYGTS